MKKLLVFILIIFISTSCEDVIDVEVPNAAPRLVIDASIDWIDGKDGKEQDIKLTLSSPYFGTEIPPANGATVTVKDTNGNTFTFLEDGNTGVYRTSNFIPTLNQEYELTIVYNNETYVGTEKLMPVTEIDYIEQNNSGGFDGDEIDIKAYYTDPEDEENFYYFKFSNDIPTPPSLEVYNDDFTNGNQTFAFYNEEDLLVLGTEISIRNHGVSERFFDFMSVLLRQSNNEGGPFETQPATVRGNCVNITNEENFPFGYFRVSQVNEFIYIVE